MRRARTLLGAGLAVAALLCLTVNAASASASGFSWHVRATVVRFGYGINGSGSEPSISCASLDFCAISAGQFVWTSTSPESSRRWTQRRVEPAATFDSTVTQLTCPNAMFCLGTATHGVVGSSDPSGAAAMWQDTPLEISSNPSVTTATCPNARLCVLGVSENAAALAGTPGADENDIAVSVDPASASPAFRTVSLPTGPLECDDEGPTGTGPEACASPVTGASCPSTRLCVATDMAGQVLTSADASQAASWHAEQVLPSRANLYSGYSGGNLTCPTTRFCAIWENDEILASTHPGGGSSSWHITRLGDSHITELTCASADLCVALDDTGNVYFSTDPAAAAPQWIHQRVDTQAANLVETPLNYTVSCPTAQECVMVDPAGRVLVGQLTQTG